MNERDTMKANTRQSILSAFSTSTDLSAIAQAHSTRVASVLRVIRAVVREAEQAKGTGRKAHEQRWLKEVAA